MIYRLLISIVLTAAMLPATTRAQTHEQRRDIDRLEQMIDALHAEAHAAEEAGRLDVARELYRDAEEVQSRLNHLIADIERRHAAEDEHREHGEHDAYEAHMHETLEHIEMAMHTLRELGHHDDALHHLEVAAENVRHRIHRHQEEREIERERERWIRDEHDEDRDRDEAARREIEVARRQIRVMHLGIRTLEEADRDEDAERLEHAARVRELNLEGERGEEANELREGAPNRAEIAELLGIASRYQAEWGNDDAAHTLAETASAFARRGDRRHERERERERDHDRARERERDREHEHERHHLGDEDRRWLMHEAEMFRKARRAFAEAGRERAAELAEHVIHANELMLEGHDGEDAMHVIESAPEIGARVELMQLAAQLYEEWGHEGDAEALSDMSDHYRRAWEEQRHEREHDHDRHREREREDDREDHVEALERHIMNLHEELEMLRRELQELRDRDDH